MSLAAAEREDVQQSYLGTSTDDLALSDTVGDRVQHDPLDAGDLVDVGGLPGVLGTLTYEDQVLEVGGACERLKPGQYRRSTAPTLGTCPGGWGA